MDLNHLLGVGLAVALVGCGDSGGSDATTSTEDSGADAGESGDGGPGSSGADSSGTQASDGDGSTGASTSGETSATSGNSTSGATSGGGTTGGGSAELCGSVIFAEPFEDTNFASRDWYDGPSADLSTTEHVTGSTSSFECRFAPGATGCAGGTPGRHLFGDQQAVCLRYWVKYSANYVGSQRPYHPHEFHFITNEDTQWVGPANTHLTTYIEQVGGTPRLAIQDAQNVDLSCVLLNNDTFVGCNGDFDTYPFTEDRSAASCNGLLGDLDGRDCFPTGGGNYYSARFWDSSVQVFSDSGDYDKNEWHLIESYWRLNTISGGIGQTDGAVRYWFDGQEIIAYDQILMRTGAHPNMAFNQFLIAPYIGDGSPVDQVMWIDDLEVLEGAP